MDAAVRLHRDHRAETAVYGHHATVAGPATVAGAATVVIGDHHHLSAGGCWRTEINTI